MASKKTLESVFRLRVSAEDHRMMTELAEHLRCSVSAMLRMLAAERHRAAFASRGKRA